MADSYIGIKDNKYHARHGDACSHCGHVWADDHDKYGCIACEAGAQKVYLNPIADSYDLWGESHFD